MIDDMQVNSSTPTQTWFNITNLIIHHSNSNFLEVYSAPLPLSVIALLLRIASRSLFNFNLMIDKLLGLIPTGALAPLTFSFVTRSI
jgi:hypothetical protein